MFWKPREEFEGRGIRTDSGCGYPHTQAARVPDKNSFHREIRRREKALMERRAEK